MTLTTIPSSPGDNLGLIRLCCLYFPRAIYRSQENTRVEMPHAEITEPWKRSVDKKTFVSDNWENTPQEAFSQPRGLGLPQYVGW